MKVLAISLISLNESEIKRAMEEITAVEAYNKLSTSWGFIKSRYVGAK